MTLDELHELRDKAGIKFTKSWNCIDAEKNIHLVDKDKFFDKILERLKKMGYKPLRDFDFEVVRYKFPYAERHHIGRTYEWKYFYSTTFEITDDLLDYLTYHNFITKKEDEEKPKTKQTVVNLPFEASILHNERKIKRLERQEQMFLEKGQLESAENVRRGIENCKEKIENIKHQIELRNKRNEENGKDR